MINSATMPSYADGDQVQNPHHLLEAEKIIKETLYAQKFWQDKSFRPKYASLKLCYF